MIFRSSHDGPGELSKNPQCPPCRVSVTLSEGDFASRAQPARRNDRIVHRRDERGRDFELREPVAGDRVAVQILLQVAKCGELAHHLRVMRRRLARRRNSAKSYTDGPGRLLLQQRARSTCG